MFQRPTNMLVLFTRAETKYKHIGEEYSNRVFYPWYLLTFLLLVSSMAAFFLSTEQAELRFKFGLACIFFLLLQFGVVSVF